LIDILEEAFWVLETRTLRTCLRCPGAESGARTGVFELFQSGEAVLRADPRPTVGNTPNAAGRIPRPALTFAF
jgi:hypothetical protein